MKTLRQIPIVLVTFLALAGCSASRPTSPTSSSEPGGPVGTKSADDQVTPTITIVGETHGTPRAENFAKSMMDRAARGEITLFVEGAPADRPEILLENLRGLGYTSDTARSHILSLERELPYAVSAFAYLYTSWHLLPSEYRADLLGRTLIFNHFAQNVFRTLLLEKSEQLIAIGISLEVQTCFIIWAKSEQGHVPIRGDTVRETLSELAPQTLMQLLELLLKESRSLLRLAPFQEVAEVDAGFIDKIEAAIDQLSPLSGPTPAMDFIARDWRNRLMITQIIKEIKNCAPSQIVAIVGKVHVGDLMALLAKEHLNYQIRGGTLKD